MSDTPEKIAAERLELVREPSGRWYSLRLHGLHIWRFSEEEAKQVNDNVRNINELAAYAQGPRADAGVLEKFPKKRIPDGLENEFDRGYIKGWNDCLSDAESALSRPQSVEPPVFRQSPNEQLGYLEPDDAQPTAEGPKNVKQAILELLPIQPVDLLNKLCGGPFLEREVKEALSDMAVANVIELTSDRVLRKLPTPAPVPEGPEKKVCPVCHTSGICQHTWPLVGVMGTRPTSPSGANHVVTSAAEKCALEIAYEMFGEDGPSALKDLEEIISRHFPSEEGSTLEQIKNWKPANPPEKFIPAPSGDEARPKKPELCECGHVWHDDELCQWEGHEEGIGKIVCTCPEAHAIFTHKDFPVTNPAEGGKEQPDEAMAERIYCAVVSHPEVRTKEEMMAVIREAMKG